MKWVPLDVANYWPLEPQGDGVNVNREQSLDPYVAWGAATGFSGFTTNGQFRRPPRGDLCLGLDPLARRGQGPGAHAVL